MTKRTGARFGYLNTPANTETQKQTDPDAAQADELKTVPKGEGRMKQDRAQLNIRIPEMLKRRAGAKAMLEGRTLAEVVEEFLHAYTNEPQ